MAEHVPEANGTHHADPVNAPGTWAAARSIGSQDAGGLSECRLVEQSIPGDTVTPEDRRRPGPDGLH